jgi:DNA-binding response OmpR family regulator
MARILVVEDEPDFARFLTGVMKKEGFLVSETDDGLQALKMVKESPPDLILLDWNLPGKSGIDVCRLLKTDPGTRAIPIIMLTARGAETDAVLGLEMGADDYVVKRVLRPRELVARVRAALRKTAVTISDEKTLCSGPLVVDVGRREARLAGKLIDLRMKEFDLLCVFLRSKGRVLTRPFITESVWGNEYFGTSRTIDTTLGRLREKLGREAHRFQSIKGLGYKFEED